MYGVKFEDVFWAERQANLMVVRGESRLSNLAGAACKFSPIKNGLKC